MNRQKKLMDLLKEYFKQKNNFNKMKLTLKLRKLIDKKNKTLTISKK